MLTEIKPKVVKAGEAIFFSYSPEIFFEAIITQVNEKSVKVDYALESIWNKGVTVYTKTCFIPVSVIVHEESGLLTVKKWFSRAFKNEGYHIKKYFLEPNGQKVFV